MTFNPGQVTGEEFDLLNNAAVTDLVDALLATILITPASGPRDLSIVIDDVADSLNEGAFINEQTVQANEQPVANPDEFTITEDAGLVLPVSLVDVNGRNILANDTDAEDGAPSRGNIISVTGTTVVASDSTDPAGLDSPGTVVFVPNGENTNVAFTTDGSDNDSNGVTSDFNYLDEGESAVVSFNYTINDDTDLSDPAEATSTASVTITITGENDGIFIVPDVTENDPYFQINTESPEEQGDAINSVVTGLINELDDGSLTPEEENNTLLVTNGTVRYIDPDVNDTHQFNISAPLAQQGSVDGDSPFLGQSFGATINSSNAPVGYVGAFNVVLDDGEPLDPEDDQVLWTFEVEDSLIDLLSGDQSFTQTYNLTIFENDAADELNGAETATQTITVTITGTNDAPVIEDADGAATVSASLIEDVDADGADASGTILVTDVDLADTVQQSVRYTSITRVPTVTNGDLDEIENPTPGTVDLENDGRPSDGELEQMISLVGGQNGVVIPGVNSLSEPTSGSGTAGTVTWEFDASGGDAGQVFDYLGTDESVVITYTITVTDFGLTGVRPQPETSDSIDVNITVTGTNDDVVIESADSIGGVTEVTEVNEFGDDEGNINFVVAGPIGLSDVIDATVSVPLTTSGTVTFTDIDFSDTHTTSVAKISSTLPEVAPTEGTNLTDVNGGNAVEVLGQTFGELTILGFVDSTGDPAEQGTQTGSFTWEYTVEDAVIEQLGEGETLVEVFEITIDDEEVPSGSAVQTVTITVTGTNDQPVFLGTLGLGEGGGDSTVQIPGLISEGDANVGITDAQLEGVNPLLDDVRDIDVHNVVTILDIDATVTGDGADGATNLVDPDPSSGVTREEALEILSRVDNVGATLTGETAIEGSTIIGNDATEGD